MLALGTGCAVICCHYGRAHSAGEVYTTIARLAAGHGFRPAAVATFPSKHGRLADLLDRFAKYWLNSKQHMRAPGAAAVAA
jgi:hypothetical protein